MDYLYNCFRKEIFFLFFFKEKIVFFEIYFFFILMFNIYNDIEVNEFFFKNLMKILKKEVFFKRNKVIKNYKF